jgi:hypothetical protein
MSSSHCSLPLSIPITESPHLQRRHHCLHPLRLVSDRACCGLLAPHPTLLSLKIAPLCLPQNQLAVQLLCFFFETVQRIFKVPASVDLSYQGFEVSFSTDSVPWNDSSVVSGLADDEDGEQDRAFEMMPTPSDAALRRWYSWSCVSRRNRKRRRAGLNGV